MIPDGLYDRCITTELRTHGAPIGTHAYCVSFTGQTTENPGLVGEVRGAAKSYSALIGPTVLITTRSRSGEFRIRLRTSSAARQSTFTITDRSPELSQPIPIPRRPSMSFNRSFKIFLAARTSLIVVTVR